jgi:hypothetical protein
MNKNAAFTVSSASRVLAADEAPTIIPGPTVLYLAGAVALGVALLFHTFAR